MQSIALDPSPLNQLGKGIFSAETEAKLIADGYIFAANLPGTLVKAGVRCKRRIADAVTDSEIGSLRMRQHHPVPTP